MNVCVTEALCVRVCVCVCARSRSERRPEAQITLSRRCRAASSDQEEMLGLNLIAAPQTVHTRLAEDC